MTGTSLAFLLFAIVTAGTPGPNNVMLTATGANFGFRRVCRICPISFGEAAASQWVNPKAWLVCIAAVGTYAIPGEALWARGLRFALLYFPAALACSATGRWRCFPCCRCCPWCCSRNSSATPATSDRVKITRLLIAYV